LNENNFMKGEKSLGVKGNILRIPTMNSIVWNWDISRALNVYLWKFQRLHHLDIWIYLCCWKYLNKENKKVRLHSQSIFLLKDSNDVQRFGTMSILIFLNSHWRISRILANSIKSMWITPKHYIKEEVNASSQV
jgi:hypothetical protein